MCYLAVQQIENIFTFRSVKNTAKFIFKINVEIIKKNLNKNNNILKDSSNLMHQLIIDGNFHVCNYY